MDLHDLSVGLEQLPKLLLRRLRIQVSNEEAFHVVSSIGNYLLWAVLGQLGKGTKLREPRATAFRDQGEGHPGRRRVLVCGAGGAPRGSAAYSSIVALLMYGQNDQASGRSFSKP